MIDAWPSGFPPSGVFEGTFSDLGSYHQCKDIRLIDGTRKISSMYCTIKFKPLLPTRPRFHNIHEQIPLFEKFYKKLDVDAMSLIASKAQYFWYTSFRFGVCLPVISDKINSSTLKCALSELHQLAQKGQFRGHKPTLILISVCILQPDLILQFMERRQVAKISMMNQLPKSWMCTKLFQCKISVSARQLINCPILVP